MDRARYAAAAAIARLHRGGYANLTANTLWDAFDLDAQQKAFAGALFYTAAERLVTLDALLAPFLKQPVEKLDVEIRAVLETGLCQMLYMNVPPRAAVHEAVQLARAFKKTSAAGLVNAVLRKAQSAQVEELQFGSEAERVSVLYSVSLAVAGAVMRALPESYEAFLAKAFEKPELCLRVNTLRTSDEELAGELRQEGAAVRAGQLEGCLYADMPGGVAHSGLFRQGMYHVQGEASQFACACVGAKPGAKVLDLCAAPGGKTATLAQQMRGGQGLVARDVRENRLPLIEQNLARLGIEGVRVQLGGAALYDKALEGQRRVLCDVPCSGLGVLAKKTDIRYATGENFETLPGLQLAILETAARYVAPGGRLVYSTCTVRQQENGDVVRNFLRGNPGFALIKPGCAPKGAVFDEEMVTILPHLTGLDGFFVATLERL